MRSRIRVAVNATYMRMRVVRGEAPVPPEEEFLETDDGDFIELDDGQFLEVQA